MNCTTCKYNKLLEAARLDPSKKIPADELDDILRHCLKCDPELLPHGASSFVHLGDLDPSDFTIAADYAASRTPSEQVTRLPPETENAFRILLAELATLDLEDIQIVWGLLRKMSLGEIATAIGAKDRQLIYYRLKRAIAAHPWIRRFYVGAK